MAIYPKCDHTLYSVLITKTKTLSNTFALIFIGFLFFSFFFGKLSTWSPFGHHHPPWSSSCSTTWYVLTLLTWHLWQRLVLRFHQLAKTKLGLSISPFLVIDDNSSQRYSMKYFRIHVACPSILPCVNVIDKFHKPKLVALAPPTYVLRVWIWKLAHMHR